MSGNYTLCPYYCC